MTKRLSLIIGVVLAILSAVLVKVYLDQRTEHIQGQARKAITEIQKNQTAVLVARQDIAKGELIDSTMLEAATVPNQYVVSQAVTSFDRIAGMAAIAPIPRGEQISLTKLMPARAAATTSLSMATPVGKRAITIPVDNISSLGGMIKPGDYVDLLGTAPVPVQTADGKTRTQEITLVVFQNVLVLAVGRELGGAQQVQSRGRKEDTPTASPIITLALTLQETNFLSFLQGQSKIRLTLRSPADTKVEPIQPASWDTLFRHLNLVSEEQVEDPSAGEEKKPKAQDMIEIYRGQTKEIIPLTRII